MRNRKEQESTSLPNPIVRYYNFKGKSDGFVWYNSETKAEETSFPLSFSLLTVRNEVSGYHKRTKSGIWSNSISEYGVGKEELRVYSNKKDKAGNTAIAQGIWKEIREKTKGQGGHFTKVLIGYEFGVGIVKVSITGTAIASYGEFAEEAKKAKTSLYDNLIVVKDLKKLDEEDDYTIPVFASGKKLTAKQDEEVNQAYNTIMDYFESKNLKVDEVENEEETNYQSTGVSAEELAPPKRTQEADALPF